MKENEYEQSILKEEADYFDLKHKLKMEESMIEDPQEYELT